jgi:hypothetical protein
MPHRILSHLRSNAIAYAALLLSMTGTSVAAVDLANHSIDPVKLDARYIGGYVREWASVDANGHVTASGGRVTVRMQAFGALPGHYYVTWHTRVTSSCAVIGSVEDESLAGGYLTGSFIGKPAAAPRSIIATYDPQGQATNEPFVAELVCATPR